MTMERCDSDHLTASIVTLVCLMAIPIVATGILAWKTKDEKYTESMWVFILMLVQVEVILVDVPIVAVLRNVSAEGRYIGYALMLWLFPMSTLSIIMIPKFVKLRRELMGVVSQRSIRGQLRGIRVYQVSRCHEEYQQLEEKNQHPEVLLLPDQHP